MSDLVNRQDVLSVLMGMRFAIRMNEAPYDRDEIIELIDWATEKVKEFPSINQRGEE